MTAQDVVCTMRDMDETPASTCVECGFEFSDMNPEVPRNNDESICLDCDELGHEFLKMEREKYEGQLEDLNEARRKGEA